MNVIEAVVMPLKTDAMNRAEQYARAIVADVRKELAAAGNDMNICAPYPSSLNYGSRAEYAAKLSKYKLFCSLCQSRQGSRRMNEPDLCDVNSNYVAKFVKEAREDAAFQYEAFVAKLNRKIGAAVHATLVGNHIWAESFLTVELPNGEKQIWKTKHILNRSKLGKVFNQFPSRIVKAVN